MNAGDEQVAQGRDRIERAWSLPPDTVLHALGVEAVQGLSVAEVRQRLLRTGGNRLRQARRPGLAAIVIEQFRSLVVVLLLGAAGLAFLFDEILEGIAIACVLAINTAIGAITEYKAVRSMDELRKLGRVETRVRRQGAVQRVPAESLVPGDIVLREAGDIVTADMRLLEAVDLQADESTLTGESAPQAKHERPLGAATPLADRDNMLFKGTSISRGSAVAVVTATGMDTELGRIAALVATAKPEQSPLEKRLDRLGARLARAVIVLAVVIAAAGVAVGRELLLAVEVAIALAVAAIPEGLPIVATIALARGMWRMAERNALIVRLSAVETLGTTNVIVTDKTGTLTENRMTVTDIRIAGRRVAVSDTCDDDSRCPDNEQLAELLAAGVLCNNAAHASSDSSDGEFAGDPTETALVAAAARCGIDPEATRNARPRLYEHAFDAQLKLMATVHDDEGRILIAVKGAPEAVLDICSHVRTDAEDADMDAAAREAWLGAAREFGDEGLRTLAIATRAGSQADEEPYTGLTLLGIVGLEDPARPEVHAAIRRCLEAGMRIVMVTGDHPATARQIAADVGIVAAGSDGSVAVAGEAVESLVSAGRPAELQALRVVSRATPQQKLQLIEAFQRHGDVVAMTGDGVNDAPALKKADIGVAMGIRGTAVAREAAAMVLQDDNFATIVEAVAQGRAIYENIRKFAVYLLSCNVSEILVVLLATLAGAPLPLLPLQILFLNLVTDVFPALALGVGEGSPALMQRPPRPGTESLLVRVHWWRIALHGVLLSATVLLAMTLAIVFLQLPIKQGVTVSFCTLALAQLWHVFNMRGSSEPLLLNSVTRNPWVWAALALCVALLLAAVYQPVLAEVLSLSSPGPAGWLVISVMSLLPVVAGPLVGRLAAGIARSAGD